MTIADAVWKGVLLVLGLAGCALLLVGILYAIYAMWCSGSHNPFC